MKHCHQNYDIKEKFHKFNIELFDGQLPVPKFGWESRNGWCGMFYPETGSCFPGKLHLSKALYTTEEKYWDEVLVHEMVHLWQWAVLGKDPNHRKEFKEICRKLHRKSGLGLSVQIKTWKLTEIGLREWTPVALKISEEGKMMCFVFHESRMAGVLHSMQNGTCRGVVAETIRCGAAGMKRGTRIPSDHNCPRWNRKRLKSRFLKGRIRIIKSFGMEKGEIIELFRESGARISFRKECFAGLA